MKPRTPRFISVLHDPYPRCVFNVLQRDKEEMFTDFVTELAKKEKEEV
jgi:hypothetical protein